MAIKSFSKDGVLSIRIVDTHLLDPVLMAALAQDIEELLGKREEERVVLDLRSVQFMSSAMLGYLVQLHKKCKEYKVKLKLAAISPEIRKVFKITRLDKLFDIEKDDAAARAAFGKKGHWI